jgi:hypothetical protein
MKQNPRSTYNIMRSVRTRKGGVHNVPNYDEVKAEQQRYLDAELAEMMEAVQERKRSQKANDAQV